ncbi:MAG TPA: alpha/beta fold hydrolase [Kofleriaceae bacterium]|nr:alpha/beta fold hydrolase [Kofleriaceae bacterium]
MSLSELELTAGKYGLAFLRRATAAAAGLRAGVADGIAYWQRGGEGVPLVAIHGFGGDKETWLLWAPFLARRRPLLLIDLPGHGGSRDAREEDFGARAQAEIVLQTMDLCGFDRGAVLCGNSMGGGIAQRIARTWPARALGLVLVASVAHEMAESELTRELARGQNFLIPDGETTHDEFLKRVVEKPPKVPRAVQRYVASQRAAAQPKLERVWRGWTGATGEAGVPDDPQAIAQPALIVHGDRDRVIDVATARGLAARMPRARLEVLAGVGHVPQLEEPRRVSRLTEMFVREIAG